MPRLTDRDLKMMDAICNMETALIAEKLNMTPNAINNRFAWIRRQRVDCQHFLNILLNYERKCPDLKRRLTPTSKKKH